MEEYRKEVFSRVVGCPLDAVTNQILRSRLYAYTSVLSVMRRMCNGAPDHQPCTSRGDYVDPLSNHYYSLPCLQIILPEDGQRIDALQRSRKVKATPQLSLGSSCYYCYLAPPADRLPYA